MLLIVRFILITLRSMLRKRIGPLEESVVRFTAWPHDCDLNFHLNAGRTVSLMDIARLELLGRMRFVVKLLRRGWRPVMGGAVMRYRRSILPFERFEIRSRVLGWDDKWFYIEHIAERHGTLCTIGIMRMVIRGKEGTIPPREVMALLKISHLASPPLPEFVRDWTAAEDRR